MQKKIFTFEMFIFLLKRVKNVTRIKNSAQVNENLFTCLINLALQWYIFELFENIKNLLKYDNEIEF
jgi:hypothetical protein